jgi:serine/threonine-protein kinase
MGRRLVVFIERMAGDHFGLIGQVIDGQLRVEEVVGEGGFSVVYRGHHLGLDEPIAIKCLKLSPAIEEDLVDSFIRRFRDESRICYRLSRGNLDIVRSITSGTTTTPKGTLLPYMALEWLDGQSLADDFRERRTRKLTGRPLDEVVTMFDPAATAVAYAHAQGVVHRDLKPGNLFLCTTKSGPRLKVLDFGLAKILHDEVLGTVPQKTGQDLLLFSPSYGAPEQFDPKLGKIGPWTDVYALALVLLEALRDKKVRSSDTSGVNAVIQALDPTNRPTPRRFGVDVGDAVEAVMSRAVALRPDQRPKDVGEFWKQLSDALYADGAMSLGKTAENEVPTMMARAMRPRLDSGATVRDVRPAILEAKLLATTVKLGDGKTAPNVTTEETGGTGTLVMDRPDIPRRGPTSSPPSAPPSSPSVSSASRPSVPPRISSSTGSSPSAVSGLRSSSIPPQARTASTPPARSTPPPPLARTPTVNLAAAVTTPRASARSQLESPEPPRRSSIALVITIGVLAAIAAALVTAYRAGLLRGFF